MITRYEYSKKYFNSLVSLYSEWLVVLFLVCVCVGIPFICG